MAGRRILIVEDEVQTLHLLAKKLSKKGFEILKATTAAEAVDQAQKGLPDLILMDIILSNGDGSEAVKILRSEEQTRNIPVLFLSGIVSKENGKIAQVTVDSCSYQAIPKPFTFKELLETINGIINTES